MLRSKEVARFDKNSTSFFAKGLMQAHVGASNPRPLRIDAVFIFEYATHHKYFFTAVVSMRAKVGLWRPTHQRRACSLPHKRHYMQARNQAL